MKKTNPFLTIIMLALYPILLFLGFISGIWLVNYTEYINRDYKPISNQTTHVQAQQINYSSLQLGIKKELIAENIKPIPNYKEFQPDTISVDGDSMFLNIVSESMIVPINSDFTPPDVMLAVAHKDKNGITTVVTERSKNWCNALSQVSGTLLPLASKNNLLSGDHCK